MADIWTDRLSEYVDDELNAVERTAVEAHLAACRECSLAIDEMREVVARAGRLRGRPPAADLWPGIESRLGAAPAAAPLPFQRRALRRFTFTLPQLVAAGLALMLMSGGGVWVLQHGGRATSMPPVAATIGDPVGAAPFADPGYDEAIADLQQVFEGGRAALDATTVKALEANIAAADAAIDASRRTLAADPANVALQNQLAQARQRKLAVLRRAAALVGGKSEVR